MTCANTCVPPFLLVDTQVAQTLWDFVIGQCMKKKKKHKIRPKFFLLQKIEIFFLFSSFSTHIIAKLQFLLIGSTLLS